MTSEFFETIKVLDAKHFNVAYHQQRYENVLKAFGTVNFLDLSSLFNAPKKGLYRCRIRYNTKGLLGIQYISYEKKDVKSLKIVYDDTIEYKYKSSSRASLNTLLEKKSTCDEILIVKNGLITDTSIANIALFKEGIWYTPKTVLLEGTTRARYLKEKKLVLNDISVDELDEYESVALLNAMVDFDIIRKKGTLFVK